MIKSKKIICLMVAAIAAFALGLSFNFANIGARADEIADGDFTVAKVSVRLADDEKGDGIRFAVVMKKSLYGEYAVSGNKTGVLILPEDLVGEELNLESKNVVKIYTFGDEAAEDGSVIASKWVDCNIAGYEDYKLCVVYLYGIPKNSFNRPLTVRGFVQTAAGSVIYSGVKTKSLSEVALAEVADGNRAADKYLNSYTVKFIGEHDEVIQEETKKYGERFTVPSAPAVDENSYFSGWQLLKGDTYAASADITDTTVKYSRTYKAEIKQYLTVTYLKVNGEQMGSCKVKEGGVPSLPATDKENFVINGWEIKNPDGSFTDFGSSYIVSNTAITENTVYRVRYNAVVSKAAVERGFTLDFNEGDLMTLSNTNSTIEYLEKNGERLLHVSRTSSSVSVTSMGLRSFDACFEGDAIYEVLLTAESGSISGGVQYLLTMNSSGQQTGSAIGISRYTEGVNIVYASIFSAPSDMRYPNVFVTNMDLYLRSITVRKVEAGTSWTVSGENLTLSGAVNNTTPKKWSTETISDDNPVDGVENGTYCHVTFSHGNNCYFDQLTPHLLAGYTYAVTVKGYAITSPSTFYLGSFKANGNGNDLTRTTLNITTDGKFTTYTRNVEMDADGKYIGFFFVNESFLYELYIQSVTITLVGATA